MAAISTSKSSSAAIRSIRWRRAIPSTRRRISASAASRGTEWISSIDSRGHAAPASLSFVSSRTVAPCRRHSRRNGSPLK